MLDFTSALYLGLRHASGSLEPWKQLTAGVPAALRVPPIARRVARQLAILQGCEAATLGPSTLHLFRDLGEIFCTGDYAIFLDQGAYPIARWGVEHADFVRSFNHFDVHSLGRILDADASARRPVVVCDGFCPGCGRPAPLAAYLALVKRSGGWLVIDDTQALGIFGRSPNGRKPYGEGGGGMPAGTSIGGPHLVVVASLAKAFGVPLAALSGSARFVRRFEGGSGTRMHCSPPSIASIHAMARALTINCLHGEALRSRLTTLVRRFKNRLRARAIIPTGGCFPVQTLPPLHQIDALELHQRLLRAGVATVLHRGADRRGLRISFLINTRHDDWMIDRAAETVGRIVADQTSRERNERYHDGHVCV